jgi:hypothetical protein
MFKGAGSVCVHLFFPLNDSNSPYLRARVVSGRKTRTLHKNREECGTQLRELIGL